MFPKLLTLQNYSLFPPILFRPCSARITVLILTKVSTPTKQIQFYEINSQRGEGRLCVPRDRKPQRVDALRWLERGMPLQR